LIAYELIHQPGGSVHCNATISIDGKNRKIEGDGNGPINAFVHALETAGLKDFKVTDYRSHAVRGGSDASAAAYVQLQHNDGRILWGAGVDPSIEMAGLKALVTAWNLLR
jgi:2-isopropylmalate synthase